MAPSGLHDPAAEHASCGVGLIVRKDGVQTHDVLTLAHRALCSVPHRGGMSAEGVGDGGGVSVDLSVPFFSRLAGRELTPGRFAVANVFLPADPGRAAAAAALVTLTLTAHGCTVLAVRDVPVDASVLRPAAVAQQLPVRQWIVEVPDVADPERLAHGALLDIESVAYTDDAVAGLHPLSLSTRTQVLKGRLNSWEVVPYFADLTDPEHRVRSLYFHTRFSTNTDPHPSMAQPFRLLAHNGELNTDRKNRIADEALARARGRRIVRPPGQSDSARFDQTLHARVAGDGLDLVAAVVAAMPPAWENDRTLSAPVRAMLEYRSLVEEINDGPAALVFSDGEVVGARLDRLGLRPLRTCETADYLTVSSEAGQWAFPDDDVLRRGRIEAGGMLWWSTRERRSYDTAQTLELLAARADYEALLAGARTPAAALPPAPDGAAPGDRGPAGSGDLTVHQRYVAYGLDAEAFRVLLDPMLDTGAERVSAMGYGNAINALSDREGGVAHYFSQRFAQVTNPPLDPIREADGMTLRVALGARPVHDGPFHRIVLDSTVLDADGLARIGAQHVVPVGRFALLHEPGTLEAAVEGLCAEVVAFARDGGGIAVLDDRAVARDRAAIPAVLAVAAVNRALVAAGLRPAVSLVVATGQVCSAHHLAVVLGFGGSAVHPHTAHLRAAQQHPGDPGAAFARFRAAAEKSLLKTMARIGLCTMESYVGGEFFETAYLDTRDPVLARWLPEVDAPVGGAGFADIERSVRAWHARALTVTGPEDLPQLGLFKERSDGAGHSYGAAAVTAFTGLVDERTGLTAGPADRELRLLPLSTLTDSLGLHDDAYVHTGLGALTAAEIDASAPTPGYRELVRSLTAERARRPSALRDVLVGPPDLRDGRPAGVLDRIDPAGNACIAVRGLRRDGDLLHVDGDTAPLASWLAERFGASVARLDHGTLRVVAAGTAEDWLDLLVTAPDPVALDDVQPASEITRTLASGAMSHGALVAGAHEAVAHGTNMVGGLSNCGEGGESRSRFGTIRGSRVKQFASGRFGVWAGYLADPMLEQVEIKIAQGAKPGEGGQLPGAKVTVDIAAARGATPGVELVSPPPHHDTYSIEDLAQLIHDATAARVRVVVKLVSSEGIGTIAVGVAKAGAHVINVAGNTGGTGAANVTSLKFAGRSAELGVAEVHQALSAHGLRDAVELRCSGAHQTGGDVVVSALLGADGFEFGTTALMMLRCVMAKNCNVKCPAGITTDADAFDGDPRALAQYLLGVAHEVREILASLGLRSLREARGRTDLLHLARHPSLVGRLDLRRLLHRVTPPQVADPVRVGADHDHDERWSATVRAALTRGGSGVDIDGGALGNRHRSVGGRLAVDVERMLNHEHVPGPALVDDRGRRFLPQRWLRIRTRGAAGQSFGLLCNDGMWLVHTGTANDGVGKSACGGTIAIRSPAAVHDDRPGSNVLVGNFALFGATGGRLFVHGEAGDRFAVRNSGASAVVEGLGDFGCEYMTGGAVLNLGAAGSGLGNGMSGGFLYQYDPAGTVGFSTDSVDVAPVSGFHVPAVRLLLEWHAEATGSPLAVRLLEHWDRERAHLLVATPRALRLYQDAGEILAARSRRELVDELAAALAAHQLRRHKLAQRDGVPVASGAVPDGDAGEEMFVLLNGLTVQTVAEEVAARRGVDARTLLLTEDHAVRTRLVRYARDALAGYTDDELAVLVSDKRVGDLKRSLAQRDVYGTDSPGTYGWILAQDAANTARLGRIPGVEELFAARAAPDLVGAP
ncbi:glutamate synthase-related protein [Pseudonocardia alni]|uniref:Glutamate synthase-related protein n=1 Tax=Pseudonocardia alni subsp. carboxydivorans TaxID=415010 RepID=A0ABU9AJG6_PSEA5